MRQRQSHLSLLAIDETDGHRIANAPFYAEVVAPIVAAPPEAEVDERFEEIIGSELSTVDAACFGNKSCGARITGAIEASLSRLLTEDSRDDLVQDEPVARPAIAGIRRGLRSTTDFAAASRGKNFYFVSAHMPNGPLSQSKE